jgi:hypothetical protein
MVQRETPPQGIRTLLAPLPQRIPDSGAAGRFVSGGFASRLRSTTG